MADDNVINVDFKHNGSVNEMTDQETEQAIEDSENVELLDTKTVLALTPTRVLKGAMSLDLEGCVVVGWPKNGSGLYVGISYDDRRFAIADLELAKLCLFDVKFND